ncbi:hypothetical protein Bca52824_066548 [Brassica carinata]|uniref:Uncharacterized protein n=1 Tax=Brassica carinata TaxID=52824 RepID=A0A8X7QLQ1_BRACI|nr:hypothetical protein Bca52824_066548 [Brassica carinata]
MSRRFSRSEKGKWQAPQEPTNKRPPVRILADDCENLIESNRRTVIGRVTNPSIQRPRAVIDFMAQESTCPQRDPKAPPSKDRILGITQQIALQRIESEKRRHDDRRGYRRPDEAHINARTPASSYELTRRDRSIDLRYRHREVEYRRDNSVLSRTARSNSGYRRTEAPNIQYRVVEKSRQSSGSSTPYGNPLPRQSLDQVTGNIPQVQIAENHQSTSTRVLTPSHDLRDRPQLPTMEVNAQPSASKQEITPARNLQSRIDNPNGSKDASHSGSRERRSALARLSEPIDRMPPSFESGRLQVNEDNIEGEVIPEQMEGENEAMESTRVPTVRRLRDKHAGSSRTVFHSIPLAPQSKSLAKRKVTTRKRITRSPLQTLALRRSTTTRSSTSTRRMIVEDKESTIPCNKAGSSKQRKNNGAPILHFIHYFSIPPIGLSGGLSLFWNDDTDITILESSPNLVDTRVVHKGVTTFVSFVYGAPQQKIEPHLGCTRWSSI